MRLAIVLATTIATLMHFTVGCCLHGMRCDGVACRATGGGDDRSTDCLGDCLGDHCHACDDGHDVPQAAIAADGPIDGVARVVVAAAQHASGPVCAGCHCAAVLEARTVDLMAFGMPLTAAFDAMLTAGRSVASSVGPCGHVLVADSSVRVALVPPLFERLLV